MTRQVGNAAHVQPAAAREAVFLVDDRLDQLAGVDEPLHQHVGCALAHEADRRARRRGVLVSVRTSRGLDDREAVLIEVDLKRSSLGLDGRLLPNEQGALDDALVARVAQRLERFPIRHAQGDRLRGLPDDAFGVVEQVAQPVDRPRRPDQRLGLVRGGGDLAAQAAVRALDHRVLLERAGIHVHGQLVERAGAEALGDRLEQEAGPGAAAREQDRLERPGHRATAGSCHGPDCLTDLIREGVDGLGRLGVAVAHARLDLAQVGRPRVRAQAGVLGELAEQDLLARRAAFPQVDGVVDRVAELRGASLRRERRLAQQRVVHVDGPAASQRHDRNAPAEMAHHQVRLGELLAQVRGEQPRGGEHVERVEDAAANEALLAGVLRQRHHLIARDRIERKGRYLQPTLADDAERDRHAVVARVFHLGTLNVAHQTPIGLPRVLAHLVEPDQTAVGRQQEAAPHADGQQRAELGAMLAQEAEDELLSVADPAPPRQLGVVVEQLGLVEAQLAIDDLAQAKLRRERTGIYRQGVARPGGTEVKLGQLRNRQVERERDETVSLRHSLSPCDVRTTRRPPPTSRPT